MGTDVEGLYWDNYVRFDRLPDGDCGIAIKYPRDNGIGNDPDIILSENFTDYKTAGDMRANYRLHNAQRIRFTPKTESANGGRAVDFFMPVHKNKQFTGLSVNFDEHGYDEIYIRCYIKFSKNFNLYDPSNGIYVAKKYYEGEHTEFGVKANGYNKFAAGMGFAR